MAKDVSCIHAGFEECEFLVRSGNEAELIELVRRHAEQTHDVTVSRTHVERIMRDVPSGV